MENINTASKYWPVWLAGPALPVCGHKKYDDLDRKEYMPAGSVERCEYSRVGFAAQSMVCIDQNDD